MIAWWAPALLSAGVGALSVRGKRGTPSTSEPILMDTVDPEFWAMLKEKYGPYLDSAMGAGDDLGSFEGDLNVSPSGRFDAAARGFENLRFSPGGMTREEQELMRRYAAILDETGMGEFERISTDMQGRASDQFDQAIGRIMLANNLSGSARGGVSQTAQVREAGQMSRGLAGDLASLLATIMSDVRQSQLRALSDQQELIQNPWRREIDRTNFEGQRLANLADLGMEETGLQERSLDRALKQYWMDKDFERMMKYELPAQALSLGTDMLGTSRKEIGYKSQGGTPATPGAGGGFASEIARLFAEREGRDKWNPSWGRQFDTDWQQYPDRESYDWRTNGLDF